MAHENIRTKPCVFTAPDTHTAYMYIQLSQAKTTTDVHANYKKSADREESA